MNNSVKTLIVLVAEDDDDDRLMIADSFDESRVRNVLHFVEDGEELLDYVRYAGKYRGAKHELPDVILLDLNMPRKDGREALMEIKADPALQHIPVIVLTTSRAEEDILKSYKLGVAGFIVKPVTFQGFIDMLKSLGSYWLDIVELPHER